MVHIDNADLKQNFKREESGTVCGAYLILRSAMIYHLKEDSDLSKITGNEYNKVRGVGES